MTDELVETPEVVETPAPIETPESDGLEAPVETPEGEQPEGIETPEGETPDVVAGPDKIKAHIEALKKTDPVLAKEIKNLFFAADALKKEIPGGLPEIRQMKATIDELGGADGIESIKAEKAEWAQIDADFAAGNVKVLDKFAEVNPEGFSKLIPAALDNLATVDRESYNHALSGIFVSTLDSWKFTD